MEKKIEYTEKNIRSLDWREHIRFRPGMYIGKLGDGTAPDDGIYLLIKEVIDNSIDEYVMGFGKKIEIDVDDNKVVVRDYGRGIPLGKVFDCVAKINTGGKYDSEAFQKSVGLNGVGVKAVNALSSYFKIESTRQGTTKVLEFCRGELLKEHSLKKTEQKDGTITTFVPDESIFTGFRFVPRLLDEQIWHYAYLNAGLHLIFNKNKYCSKNGLFDLLTYKTEGEDLRYPIIHLGEKDIEIALAHGNRYGEQYHSFVNGQFTSQGGTHQSAFREALVKTLRDFYKKDFDAADIRQSIIGAISVRVQEPVFESQTKTKLGSQNMAPKGVTVRSFVNDFVKRRLDDYLHRNSKVAEAMLKRIQQSEKERKEIAGVRKLANQRAKKANIHNKKLRDCRIHLTSRRNARRNMSTIFITEGDSASGSITKARDVETQAVFSLRGKPMNTFGQTKKVVYENEEFNLLQHALNIENGLDGLRYNRVVIATDADVDGMHIRMLLLTFFLRFFPELVKENHLYLLETPLFRVRNSKKTEYCYNEKEKRNVVSSMGKNAEVTRFKGLGEISPGEFGRFIGKDIRLRPILLKPELSADKTLAFYMGKNTADRQFFIIDNLQTEDLRETQREKYV